MTALARYQGLSGAGKGKMGLVLCCHVSPVPSVRHSTVLYTDSVIQADKGRPSGSVCPTHCTTGNYHHHHPISGLFKWGKLICRLGAVPATTPCMHILDTCINRNGHIYMFMHTHSLTQLRTSVKKMLHAAETGTHMHTHKLILTLAD